MEDSKPPADATPTRVIDSSEFLVSDLTADPLLRGLPRTTFQGQTVPSLGGIPLLEKLGQGGMGAVYRGLRVMLQQEVAVKVLPLQFAARQEGLTDRFIREAQIAATIESPHLVRVTDVAEVEGLFYLVMEYVRGPSASRLLKSRKIEEADALDICIAATRGLAAAHQQGIIHRDIKPDNILVPQTRDGKLLFASAKVADLGLARKEDGESGLTASNIGMGTPGYMAPEQAMSARRASKASDVFGMGATLYALLAGHAPFTGDSAASIIIATVQEPHPPIRSARADVSEATAKLLDQSLAKDPTQRFTDAPALLEALQVCRNALTGQTANETALVALTQLQHRTEVGQPLLSSEPTIRAQSSPAPPSKRPVFAIAAVVLLIALAAIAFLSRNRFAPHPRISVACGPEQAEWIRWAAAEFAKTDAGRNTVIDVIPLADHEVQAVLLDGSKKLNAWAPMTTLTRGVFENAWQAKNGRQPIARSQTLGVTPHVFIMLKSRYDAFAQKYGQLNFETLRAALLEQGGWAAISAKPEWGRFTFAVTRPSKYAGGLSSLTLMAFDHDKKDDDLTIADVTSPAFEEYARGFRRAFDVQGSPGDVLESFVLKGPSAYDGMLTYECSILNVLDDIEDRWGAVQLVYPRENVWSESSYYVLDVPWTSAAQRRAVEQFGDFLLTDAAQQKMVMYGFRPANPRAKIRVDGSPFKKYVDRGVQVEVPIAVVPPTGEVVAALMKEAAVIESR